MPDYAFYTTQYFGDSIPGDEFYRLAKRAEEQLNIYKRIYTVTAPGVDAEAMAICAMADALYFYETAQNGAGGAVSSATIGSVKVSYAGVNTVDMSQGAQERGLYRAAKRYIDIYRGCGAC